MPSGSPSPGCKLRDAWAAGPFALPGAFNPLVAKLAERLGFRAVYLSGGALSAGNGVPDIGLLTLSEFVAAAQLTAQATSLPLLCDADTGFGEALNVERTVRMFEAAGVAGSSRRPGNAQTMRASLGQVTGERGGDGREDPRGGRGPPRPGLRDRRAHRRSRRHRLRRRGGWARLYLAAGADAIFPEAMENAAEFAAFAKAVPCPLLANMTEFGRGPLLDVQTLGAMGYRMILFPLTAFRVAMRAAEDTLRDLLEKGTQVGSVAKMMTRAELYDALGYTGYEARDRASVRPVSPTRPARLFTWWDNLAGNH